MQEKIPLITRLEEIILMAICRLEGDAYGVTIHKEVSQITEKLYAMGSLYFSLDQLHRKKLVLKSAGNPTPERGGRSKVFYTLSPRGKEALQAVKRLHESLWNQVPDSMFIKGR